MKSIFLFLLPLMLFVEASPAQVSANPPAQTIPSFTFLRFNNTPFTNKDIPANKKVFFMFIDPDCDHCQHAMKNVGEQFQAFGKTTVIIVSMFEPYRVNKFMDLYGSKLKGKVNVTLLQDTQQQFIARFKPVKYPAMLLYSAKNKLLDFEDDPESVFKLVNALKQSEK